VVLGGEEKGTVVVLTRTTGPQGPPQLPSPWGVLWRLLCSATRGAQKARRRAGGHRAEQRDEDAEVGEVAAPEISGRGTSEACHPGASGGGDDANPPDWIRAGYLRSSEEKAGSSPGGRRR